jgi:hypothetical protein
MDLGVFRESAADSKTGATTKKKKLGRTSTTTERDPTYVHLRFSSHLVFLLFSLGVVVVVLAEFFPLDGCTPLTVYRTPAGKSQLHLKRYNPRTAVLQHIGKYR